MSREQPSFVFTTAPEMQHDLKGVMPSERREHIGPSGPSTARRQLQPSMSATLGVVVTRPATPSYTQKVKALFEARPNAWIPWFDVQAVGGACGWRTRISECRRWYRMVIDNEERQLPNGVIQSEYRFVPEARLPIQG